MVTGINFRDHLQPSLRAVASLPRLELSAEELVTIGHGQTFRPTIELPAAAEIAAVDASGRLASILVPRGEGHLGPLRNLPVDD